jgi:hypothetical protein
MSAYPVRRLALPALCALLLLLLLLPTLLLPDVAAQSPTPTPPSTPTLTPTPTWWQFAAPDWVEPLPGYGGWIPAILVVMFLFALLVAAFEGVREAVKDFSKAAVEQTVGRLLHPNRARQRSYLACLRERYGKIKPLGIARHDRVLLDIGEIHVPLRIEAPHQGGFGGAMDAAFADSAGQHSQCVTECACPAQSLFSMQEERHSCPCQQRMPASYCRVDAPSFTRIMPLRWCN